MTTQPSPRRRLRWWVVALTLFALYNAYLVVSPHRIRASFVPIVDDVGGRAMQVPPSNSQVAPEPGPPKSAESIQSLYPLPELTPGPPSVRARQLFAEAVERFSQSDPANRCWNSESPELIAARLTKENCRAFCADYAILFGALARHEGIPARRVVMEGADGLGGASHVATELWLDDLQQWVLFDPSYFTLMRDESGRYLSALEVRDLIMSGHGATIQVEVLAESGALLSAREVVDYYATRITDLQHVNDPIARREDQSSVVRQAMSRVEQSLAGFGPQWALPPRLLGRLLYPRTRYRVVDDATVAPYQTGPWYWAYRVGLALLLLSILGAVVARLAEGRRDGKRSRG